MLWLSELFDYFICYFIKYMRRLISKTEKSIFFENEITVATYSCHTFLWQSCSFAWYDKFLSKTDNNIQKIAKKNHLNIKSRTSPLVVTFKYSQVRINLSQGWCQLTSADTPSSESKAYDKRVKARSILKPIKTTSRFPRANKVVIIRKTNKKTIFFCSRKNKLELKYCSDSSYNKTSFLILPINLILLPSRNEINPNKIKDVSKLLKNHFGPDWKTTGKSCEW